MPELFPLVYFAFASAYVEGRRGRFEVLLKPGVHKKVENSWCAVSDCSIRYRMFKDKDYELEARAEICHKLCHWRRWQEKDDEKD